MPDSGARCRSFPDGFRNMVPRGFHFLSDGHEPVCNLEEYVSEGRILANVGFKRGGSASEACQCTGFGRGQVHTHDAGENLLEVGRQCGHSKSPWLKVRVSTMYNTI